MNTRYALPIAFALAVHASLMFGFRHPAGPATVVIPEKKITDTTIKVIPFEEPPPETTELASAPVGNPNPEVARQPEPKVPLSPDRPPIEINVPFSKPSRSDSLIFDTSPPGVPGGDPLGKDGPSILSSALLDNTPHARVQATPDYPFAAKREGIDGEVTVEFIVDEAGRVSNPAVVRSSNSVFNEASLRAVTKWRFEPGRRDGRIVRFRMAVPLVFRLNAD